MHRRGGVGPFTESRAPSEAPSSADRSIEPVDHASRPTAAKVESDLIRAMRRRDEQVDASPLGDWYKQRRPVRRGTTPPRRRS